MIKADPKNKKTFIKIESLHDDILYEVAKAFHEVGGMLEADLKKGLRYGKRSGKFTKVTHTLQKGKLTALKRPKNVQHSAEGEYPQKLTGLLRSAVDFEVHSYKEMWFGINDTAPYGKYLDARRKLVTYTVESTDAKQQNIIEKRVEAGVMR